MSKRTAYLAALGVPDWKKRGAPQPAPDPGRGTAEAVAPASVPAPVPAVPAPPVQSAAPAAKVQAAPPVTVQAPPAARVVPATDTWEQLAGEVTGCTRCELHTCRNRTVFGVGDRQARWLIVGEAPGAEEDKQGEPFVGRAGRLLDSMLVAIGLDRSRVFIANVLKCRPPNNRNPLPAEVAQCMSYLERQIALLKPSIMLAVGSIAAHNLLATDVPVGRLRGQVHRFGQAGTPLVVTYHPAYLLRSPGEKRKAWEDLKFARRVAEGVPA